MHRQVSYRSLNTPWAVSSDLYSAPGSLVVKLALGEAPESIPTSRQVDCKQQLPATALTVGSVDHVLNHFTHQCSITCIHSAANSLSHYHHGSHQHRFDDLEHAMGLSRTFRIKTHNDVPVSHLVDALRQLSVVEQAYPDYISTLPFQNVIAGHALSEHDEIEAWHPRNMIKASSALAYETGDPTVIVGIIDTGVAHNHPELLHMRPGLDTVQLATHNVARGVEIVGDHDQVDTDPEDIVGHGTACAGIIGAAGMILPPGLAGDCPILPIRVLAAARFPGKQQPVGIGAISDIDQGVKHAIDLGAKVINMSFGTPQSMLDPADPLPHTDIVNYGIARGCVMIAASGNTGKEEKFSPASLVDVIAVGSVSDAGQPSAFTTSGDHVALCAPGEQILSAGLQGFYRVTGTSFAAPFVTATAALLVSRAARRSHPIDGKAIKRILMQSATPWRGEARNLSVYGSGILDAFAALRQFDREIDGELQPDRRNTGGLM